MRKEEFALSEGVHMLSGIMEYQGHDDDYGYQEGIYLIIDGIVYDLYYNHDDGYRSYGGINPTSMSPSEIRMKFPAQRVEVRHCRDYKEDKYGYCDVDYFGLTIFDATNGKEVFSAGTDYADSYYPVAHFSYHPENFSINEGR